MCTFEPVMCVVRLLCFVSQEVSYALHSSTTNTLHTQCLTSTHRIVHTPQIPRMQHDHTQQVLSSCASNLSYQRTHTFQDIFFIPSDLFFCFVLSHSEYKYLEAIQIIFHIMIAQRLYEKFSCAAMFDKCRLHISSTQLYYE